MAGVTAEQRVTLPTLRSSWLHTAFVHWQVSPAAVQALLPAGLTTDVWDGSAWLTLTPFVMADMRPLGMPLLPDLSGMPGGSLPDLSSTPETNLRTYVRGPDGRDGLWFFSLDVGNPGVAAAIRAFVGAPYFPGRLTVSPGQDRVRYAGSRSGRPAGYDLTVQLGDPVEPSPLEVWLTGRWRAYTRHLGRLLVTPVQHGPWPLRSGTLEACTENLSASVDLPGAEEPLVHFSEGVTKVRIGVPRLLR